MQIVFKLTAMLLIISSAALLAQHDTIRWGSNSNYEKMYSIKTAIEIKGEILDILQVVLIKGISPEIHLIVKSVNKTISVHLGPKWYLDNQTLKLNINDKVIVRGSVLVLNGKPIIIARKIIRGNKILKIRDVDGSIDWSGIGSR